MSEVVRVTSAHTSGAGQWELVIQGLHIVGGEESRLVVQLAVPPPRIGVLAENSDDAALVKGQFICIVSSV